MPTFDHALDAYDESLQEYVSGRAAPQMALWSQREDVTLCNPIGPPVRGPANVVAAASAPSRMMSDGTFHGAEEISRVVSDDLGVVVRIERGATHLNGGPDLMPYELRVTLVFRREVDGWKVIHRHADNVIMARPVESAFDQPA